MTRLLDILTAVYKVAAFVALAAFTVACVILLPWFVYKDGGPFGLAAYLLGIFGLFLWARSESRG